jgi:hypothetical protein
MINQPAAPALVSLPTVPMGIEYYDEPYDPSTQTWDQIVRAHYAIVHRHADRLTRNRHEAEDLTQDVFVRVFRALPNYRPGGSFPSRHQSQSLRADVGGQAGS